MGIKQGVFKNREGDDIRVSFSGAGVVADDDLLFGTSPVVLSMSGTAGEFSPIKYTTGTIALIAREGEMLDLMTSHIEDVRVMVRNITTGEYIFLGFVSPNTFSQNFDSEVNEFSVEVVDFLGAAKLLPYPFDGLRSRSLREVVTRILYAYFFEIEALVVPKTLRLCAGKGATDEADKYTARYMEMQVSEIAFVESVNPFLPQLVEGVQSSMRWPAGDVTCYAVLEMIANSLLFTFVQDGDRWYLVDDLQTISALSRPQISYTTDDQWSSYTEQEIVQRDGDVYNVTSYSLMDKSVGYSSVEKFGKFTIKNAHESEVPIYPSLFSEELLAGIGTMQKVEKTEDRAAIQWQNLSNVCYDIVTPGARLMTQASLDSEVLAGIPVQLFSGLRDWEKYLMLNVPLAAERQLLLKKKTHFPVELAPRSGIGIYIKMNASVAVGYANDVAPSEFLSNDASCDIFKARIRVGNHYYDAVPTPDYEHDMRQEFWTPLDRTLNTASLRLNGSSEGWYWRKTGGIAFYAGGEYAVWDLNEWNNNIPVGGEVEVEIYAASNEAAELTVVVDSFEIGITTGYADKASYSAHDLETDIVLYTSQGEKAYGEHELPLNVCFGCCRGYLSPYIDGVNYAAPVIVNTELSAYKGFRSYLAYYYDVSDRATLYGTSIDRLAKLVNAGKNYSTELSVSDTSIASVKPYTRVVLNGDACRVVSYEKDIINNVTRIVVL